MPIIPTYQQDPIVSTRIDPRRGALAIPSAPPMVQADAAAFGGINAEATGNLARGFQDIEEAARKWQKAGQVAELNNLNIKTMDEFAKFKDGLKDRQDFKNFEPEFTDLVQRIQKGYRETVTDPGVLGALQRELSKQATKSWLDTRATARAKERDFNRGSYFGAKQDYLQMYATADPERRQDIVGQFLVTLTENKNAGTLSFEEAEKELHDFAGRTDRLRAQQDLRRSPDTFNPDQYPNLSGDERVTLNDHAVRLTEANRKEKIRLAEKAEKAAEKLAKDRREDLAGKFLVRLGDNKNPLTLPEVERAILSRGLNFDDAKFFRKALTDPPEHDDKFTLFFLKDMVREGRGSKQDIYRAMEQGRVTGQTAGTLLDELHRQEDQSDITHDPEYKDALKAIDAEVRTSGPMEKYDIDQETRVDRAKEQFKDLVREEGGREKMREIREDVINRFRPRPAGLSALPNPLFGSKQDPAAAYRKTKEAYNRGEITEAVFRREMINLKAITDILDRQPGHVTEPTINPKDKLKKRPN